MQIFGIWAFTWRSYVDRWNNFNIIITKIIVVVIITIIIINLILSLLDAVKLSRYSNWAIGRKRRVRFRTKVGHFCPLQKVFTGSGSYRASYSVGFRTSFPGGVAAGAWNLQLHLMQRVSGECMSVCDFITFTGTIATPFSLAVAVMVIFSFVHFIGLRFSWIYLKFYLLFYWG
jgi:hypothetical protein